jgi:hypothetical protein
MAAMASPSLVATVQAKKSSHGAGKEKIVMEIVTCGHAPGFGNFQGPTENGD